MSGHGASGLISQWGSTTKSPGEHTVTYATHPYMTSDVARTQNSNNQPIFASGKAQLHSPPNGASSHCHLVAAARDCYGHVTSQAAAGK